MNASVLVRILNIVEKYKQPGQEMSIEAQHDLIYIDVPWDDISKADQKLLDDLGVMEEEEHNCISIFT